MTRAAVRWEVIKALAAKRRRDPAELEAELRAAGPECPCDSQWVVKAGVSAAKTLGVEFWPTAQDKAAFRSIEALATYLHGLIEAAGAA